MSYAPSQPSSNANGMLVLITLGVCVASCLELVAVVFGYFLLMGGLFATRVATLHGLEQQRAAAQMPPPSIRQPVNPVRSPSTTSSVPPSGPGTVYASIAQVNVNDRVHIRWGSSWYAGTVIQKQGAQAKVHYDDHTNSWDEFVGLDRLRRMSPSDPKYRVNPPATASIPAPSPTIPAGSSSPPSTKDLNPPANPQPTPPPPPTATDPLRRMRTWSDSTGRFNLEAELIGVENGNVQLRRPDGKVSTMPIDKLSAADRALVRAKYPQ